MSSSKTAEGGTEMHIIAGNGRFGCDAFSYGGYNTSNVICMEATDTNEKLVSQYDDLKS